MRSALAIYCMLMICGPAMADDDHQKKHSGTTDSPLLESFKRLAGEWSGKMIANGKEISDAVAVYKVTSNGSAVVETLGPGTEHEMVTIIHPDGDALMLTHYCAIGNQPRMKATGKAGDKKVEFKFADITNGDTAKDTFMHNVTFTFLSPDEFEAEWTNYVAGKPGSKAIFRFKRKK